MSLPPLPFGTWGKIGTYVVAVDGKGRPRRYRATVKYRDFDGATRLVDVHGKTAAKAENALRARLRERAALTPKGELTALHRFSDAAKIWLGKQRDLVDEGARSPSSIDTYERQLNKHVLPALGELRLGSPHRCSTSSSAGSRLTSVLRLREPAAVSSPGSSE